MLLRGLNRQTSHFSPMGFFEYHEILLLICLISFYLFYRACTRNGSSYPTNWPLVGMLPGVIQNAHRIHEYVTDILKESGGTFLGEGPWFANMDTLLTSDPANIHHILSKNFLNYPKGPRFREIFNILGDGIFNSDADLWETHRKTTMSIFHHPEFQDLLHKTIWRKVEKGLIPFLDHASGQGAETDMQEIFQRFTFDGICMLALDYDPESLSIALPYIPCEKAFTEAEEALFYRNIVPRCLWTLQKRLQIGKEKSLNNAQKAFDEYIYKCISAKQHELSRRVAREVKEKEDEFGVLTAFMKAYKEKNGSCGDQKMFLKDTLLNLMVAGRDTTSTALTWFFYLLGKNPSVEKRILEEIHSKLEMREGATWKRFSVKELRHLVYLHGALCEALRLFPPVAIEQKSPLQDDILPSGHQIHKKTKIILSFYSMGRMETIWGKDCLEFRPERWISMRGGNKHEPSFKFSAFHAGPRTCLGKEMAFIQMKIVASTIIYNYHVELVKDHPIIPSDSIILQMKYGLKVKLTKRNQAQNVI